MQTLDWTLPILDLRSLQEFALGHLQGATHIPWPELQQALTLLPARPARLQLVGKTSFLGPATVWLETKGYDITTVIDEHLLAHIKQQHPEQCIKGTHSKRLWKANTLVTEWAQNHRSLEGLKVLDLGCGGGRTAVYLAEKKAHVTAIDNQSKVLDRAKTLSEKEGVQVDWRCCNLNADACLPDTSFDVILMLRYLNRDLLPWIQTHLSEEGTVIVQTFCEGVEAFGSPKNPNFILKKGELAKTFFDFKIIVDRIDTLADGRPVASFIAQRTGK